MLQYLSKSIYIEFIYNKKKYAHNIAKSYLKIKRLM